MYFIVSGEVRVKHFSARGRAVSFRDMAAGEMFGELAALDGQPRSAEVAALEPTFIASLTRERFLPLTVGFDSHLIAYQAEFGGVDNTTYFAAHADRSGEIEWRDAAIPHLSPVEEHHYLFGWRPRSDS